MVHANRQTADLIAHANHQTADLMDHSQHEEQRAFFAGPWD